MTNEELAAIRKRCEKAFTICTPGNPLTGYSVRLRHGFADDLAYDVPALLDHIKELESQLPRWIPVKERLPEDSEKVLACVRGLGMFALRFELDGPETISPWGTGFYNIECVWVEGVTHWQPLPEEPEE